jgi:hypothetical protein
MPRSGGLRDEPPPPPPRRHASPWPWILVAGVAVLLAAVLLPSLIGRARPDVAPPAGFSGDVRERPAVGEWRAAGRTTSTAGYLGARDVGETIVRRWTTARRCAAGSCSYVLTRELAAGDRLTSPLTRQGDGWHATFNKTLPCKVVDGRQVSWNQRSSFVFRFTKGGRRVEAHQVDVSFAPKCGYGTSRVDWTAAVVSAATARSLGGDGPVPRGRGHVNRIGERAMAASVGRAATAGAATIRAQVADVIDRRVRLEVLPMQARCRSRQNTPSGRGAPFECLVAAINPDDGRRFVLDVLVAAIEGRCWRGVNVAVKGADGRWRDYKKAAVQRALGQAPLRGCA